MDDTLGLGLADVLNPADAAEVVAEFYRGSSPVILTRPTGFRHVSAADSQRRRLAKPPTSRCIGIRDPCPASLEGSFVPVPADPRETSLQTWSSPGWPASFDDRESTRGSSTTA